MPGFAGYRCGVTDSQQGPVGPQALPRPRPVGVEGTASAATRLVLASGLVVALCIVGDSYLYSVLPLEATNLGIALPLVGVLLSANRLVRLVSNTWASRVFERWGPRRPFAAAALLSLVTSAGYAFGQGFIAFLPARLGWGVAWSGLRQGSYQAVWKGGPAARGRLMGLLWGIIRLGSALSVVAGGYLRDRFGYQVGALAIMAATATALPLALAIRWPETEAASTRGATPSETARWWDGLAAALRSTPGRRLLLTGFVYATMEGVLISTASLFLAGRLAASGSAGGGAGVSALGLRIATLAGLVLAVRWVSDILFGPAIGALSDRLSQPATLALLAATLLAGIVGVTRLHGTALVICLSLAFVSSSGLNVTLGAIANGLALETERPHLFVGAYTTAADAGSALGPLLAYTTGTLLSMDGLYLLGGGALLAASLLYAHWWISRSRSLP